MTIYFNENKQAFAFEIANPIATTDDDTWSKYADTEKWDIVDGEFKDITDTNEYKQKVESTSIETKNIDLKNRISDLESKAGTRPFREYMLSIGQVGVVTKDYPNGLIKDIDARIAVLRAQIKE